MNSEAEPPRYKNAQEAARIYFLPNFFTALNLFFGFVAMIRCIQARYKAETDLAANDLYTQAVWCILLAALSDALDGRLARLGGRESLFGKEFDSIADTVSFGVAPALMVFFLILGPSEKYPDNYRPLFQQFGWFIGFVYLLCVAVRLARFNVLTNPMIPGVSSDSGKKDFMGLPSPAAAGFVASMVLVLLHLQQIKQWAIVLPFLLLLVALLMVSSIPYPSFKHIGWQTQARARTFIVFIALMAVAFVFKEVAFFIFFLGYIFWGLGRELRREWRRRYAKTAGLDDPRRPPEEPEGEDIF